MSFSKLDKLKSRIKNDTGLTLKISSNVTGNSNDDHNFPHKLLLTNTQVSRINNAKNSSVNIKLSNPQLDKIGQWGGFLGRLFGPLLKTCLPEFPFATS